MTNLEWAKNSQQKNTKNKFPPKISDTLWGLISDIADILWWGNKGGVEKVMKSDLFKNAEKIQELRSEIYGIGSYWESKIFSELLYTVSGRAFDLVCFWNIPNSVKTKEDKQYKEMWEHFIEDYLHFLEDAKTNLYANVKRWNDDFYNVNRFEAGLHYYDAFLQDMEKRKEAMDKDNNNENI